jgi:hypothetical protein
MQNAWFGPGCRLDLILKIHAPWQSLHIQDGHHPPYRQRGFETLPSMRLLHAAQSPEPRQLAPARRTAEPATTETFPSCCSTFLELLVTFKLTRKKYSAK